MALKPVQVHYKYHCNWIHGMVVIRGNSLRCKVHTFVHIATKHEKRFPFNNHAVGLVRKITKKMMAFFQEFVSLWHKTGLKEFYIHVGGGG